MRHAFPLRTSNLRLLEKWEFWLIKRSRVSGPMQHPYAKCWGLPALFPQGRDLSVSFCPRGLWAALHISIIGFLVWFVLCIWNHSEKGFISFARLPERSEAQKKREGLSVKWILTYENLWIKQAFWKNRKHGFTNIFVIVFFSLPDFYLISHDLVHLGRTIGLGPFAAKMSTSSSSLSLTSSS